MEHFQSRNEVDVGPTRLKPHVRSARLELYDDPPTLELATRSLQYLGKTDGYGTDFSFVQNDPYASQAIKSFFGGMPDELKGYTRSGASLDRLFEGLSRYDREPPKLKFNEWLKQAILIAYNAFHIPDGVQRRSFEKIEVEGNASAGFTWLGYKKRDVRTEAQVEAEKLSRLIRNGRLSKKSLPPCVCFKRTQLAMRTEPKVRTVWGYPFEITLLEGQFAQPLIEAYSKRDCPMFIGRSMLKELPMFMDTLFLRGNKAVGLDWSGFDASHSPALISVAFEILAEQLRLTDAEWKEYWFIRDYFIDTPVIMPNGEVYIKHVGIPSGSFFTQLIGSIINFIVICTLMLYHWGGVWTRMKVLSDDSVFTVPTLEMMDLESWAKVAQAFFGLKLNMKKSFLANKPSELEFLGHSSRGGRIQRDDIKLLRLFLYPEYQVEDPTVTISRIRGLLIDSGFQSKVLLELYDHVCELFGTEASRANDKFYRYVIRRNIPTGDIRKGKLFAVS